MSATMILTTGSSKAFMTQAAQAPGAQQLHHHQRRSSSSTSPVSPYSPADSLSSPSSSGSSMCPRCGHSTTSSTATSPMSASGSGMGEGDSALALAAAQRQIEDLQIQIKLLNEKATVAVGKWADYEDELSRLRRQLNRRSSSTPHGAVSSSAMSFEQQQQNSLAFLPAGASARINALWAARSTPNLKEPEPPMGAGTVQSNPPTPGLHIRTNSAATAVDQTTDDLLVALTREQHLRYAAEARVQDTSREVEELSATLFEQANEMVAEERRARAKLEERVEVLEKRDAEKRRRLERLESAVGRIERVRKLLDES